MHSAWSCYVAQINTSFDYKFALMMIDSVMISYLMGCRSRAPKLSRHNERIACLGTLAKQRQCKWRWMVMVCLRCEVV